MATRGGYTFRDIDEMYLEEALELSVYWTTTPPLRDLVATVAHSLGVKLPTPADGKPAQGQEIPDEYEE